MRTVKISDITLREADQSALSFKERMEIARTLDRLQADVIELPPMNDPKADALSNKTIASVVAFARLSAATGLTEESVDAAWESVKNAKHPALHILLPTSAVQMEYLCHQKAPAMLELAKSLVERARSHTDQVEFSALDATRAEPAVLCQFLNAAVEAGAGTVTLCDSAGIMTPDECAAFVRDILEKVPALANVELGVELSNNLKMAVACAAASVDAGADLVKVTVTPMEIPTIKAFAAYMTARGESKGLCCNLRRTELAQAVGQLKWMLQAQHSSGSPFDNGVDEETPSVTLTAKDSIGKVVKVVQHLGYDLSEADNARVYEAFQRIAKKKPFVSARELDAIVASSAMQVPSVYRIDTYVITCGNATNAMASLTLEKDGEKLQGVCAGDGPIDAAFLAIEQIISHHYELADYQIQTVTEGREAMGSALVKLRSNGQIYSGNGISTDIIGASIRAYISALNKIVYEEGQA